MLIKNIKKFFWVGGLSLVLAISGTANASTEKKPKIIHYCSEYNNSVDILACTGYMEARGNGAAGMRDVMNVVLNRVESDYFKNKSIRSIVYQPSQFTYTRKKPIPIYDENSWKIAHNIASNLYYMNKLVPDLRAVTDQTNGALWYKTINSKASWAKHKKHTYTYKGHIFYK